MKKTKLVWRLSRLPEAHEIIALIANKVITQEEAREILFSSKTEEERDGESLKSEIKFLRELVEKLSGSRDRIIEVIKEIKVPYYQHHWYKPYSIWGNDIALCDNTSTATSGAHTLNGIASNTSNASFSNIKTF